MQNLSNAEIIQVLKERLPSTVDLRSDYEETYNQGSDNSCGAYAITACLDCMYERKTNVKHRFNKEHIWNWSKYHRGIHFSTNIGMDFLSAEATLRLSGAKLSFKDTQETDETYFGFQLVKTSITVIESLKERLAKGIPLLYTINVPLSFGNGTDWKKHTVTYNKEFTGGLHYVAVVGYDDSCQRFLFENSWGSSWGDGGFFGVPYEDMFNPYFMQGINHIDQAPIFPLAVQGFTMPAHMFSADKIAFADRSEQAIKAMLTKAFTESGYQGLLDSMKEFGVSDKHLESLLGFDRGSVRNFKLANPSLNWDGFVWDQL